MDPYEKLKQAYKDGKTIQVIKHTSDWTVAWFDDLEPKWDQPVTKYRIRPETRYIPERN